MADRPLSAVAGGYRIGVDLGGTKIEGAVLDPGGRVVGRRRIATEQEVGYAHIVERIATVVDRLRPLAPGCERIGIGTPGSLSARDGTLKNSNTQALNGRPLLADLERRLASPVRIENDANCFALAEATAGAAAGKRVVFGVILGTGVGGGIVLDGRIWSGPQHIAGEWGHSVVDPAGPACYCGHRGCVEMLLSGPALEAAYASAAGGAVARVRAEEVTERAAHGERAAVAALDRYIGWFGRALANVIDILDPEIVVLGGGLSNLAALYEAGRAAVAAQIFNDELRTPIVQNRLGDSAGVIGAALLSAA